MSCQSVPIGRIIDRLDGFYAVNDAKGAENHLVYWLGEAEQIGDERAMLSIHNEMMGLYRKAGNREKAFESVDEVIKLTAKLALDDTISFATFYINCATVYTAFDLPQKALELFAKAQTIYEKEFANADTRLGSLYNNMSLAYADVKEYENAVNYSKKALEIMEKIPGSQPEQAVSWLNLATIVEEKDGIENACEAIEEYLDKAQGLLDLPNLEHNANYAFVCSKCAPTFEYYGRFAYAGELNERSQRIYAGT